MRWEFGVLGPVEVRRDGAPLPMLPPKPRLMLAVLLLDPGAVVSVDHLIERMWDRPPKSALANVWTSASQLRAALADPAVQGGSRLLTRKPGYLLQIDGVDVDLVAFTRLAAEGTGAAAAGRPAVAADRIGRALALWRGAVAAEDVPRTAALAPRLAALDEQRAALVEDHFDALLATGEHTTLVAPLTAALAGYPLREKLWGQLMLALYRRGDPAGAMEVYHRARTTLADQLGVDPGPELGRLYQAVLHHDPDLSAAPAATVPPAADRPQVPDPAIADTAAPGLAPPQAVVIDDVIRPRQLPPRIADLVGRADVIGDLAALLRAPGPDGRPVSQLVAVTGPAGVGKTVVAVEVAHLLADRFTDGQLFVDLLGVQDQPVDPTEVLGRLLRALGVAGEAIPAGRQERADLFRSRTAASRLLVVLDNIADEAQVRPLLPGGTGCAVILTARRAPAALAGVHLVDLDELTEDEAVALLDRVCGGGRVARERAEARRVVGYCGRLPLAIRLAGARLATRRGWSLRRLSSLLADERRRLDELAVGDLAVRASIGLSLGGLAPAAARLFALLGLLDTPDCPAWTAAAMLGTSTGGAERLLEDLVDARLVDVSGEDAAGQVRYRMHDLVRILARERAHDALSPARRQETLRRAAGAWLRRAALARHHLPGRPLPTADAGTGPEPAGGDTGPGHAADAGTGPEPVVDVGAGPGGAEDWWGYIVADPRAWFEAERAALVSIVAQAAADGMPDLAWRLSACAVGFFDLCGYSDDWRHTHETSLAAARTAGDDLGVAMMLWGLGDLYLDLDRYERALAALGEAERVFDATGDRAAQANVLARIALVHHIQGRIAPARQLYDTAVSRLAEAGEDTARAYALRGLGMLHKDLGDRDQARGCLHAALSIFQRTADPYGLASVLHRLAKAYAYWDEPAAALDYATRAAEGYEAIGDRSGFLYNRVSVGEALVALGEPAAARRVLAGCLREFDQHGDRYGQAMSLLALGRAEQDRGDLAAARARYEPALRYWRETNVLPLEARTLERLGSVHEELGDPDAARTNWHAALAAYRQMNAPDAERITALLAAPRPARR